MTLLDRYIARLFLTNVLVLLVILLSFITAVDATLNIHRFTEGADALAERAGAEQGPLRKWITTFMLVIDLWWPRCFQLFNYIIGIVTIGALGFTCSQLVRQRELVAVMAGGISLRRIARPMIAVGVLLAGLQLANQEFVLPKLASTIARTHGDIAKPGSDDTRLQPMRDASGRVFVAGGFDPDKGLLTDAHIVERDAQRLITRSISAPLARWDGSGWELQNATVMSASPGAAPAPVVRVVTDLDPAAMRIQQNASFAQSLGYRQIGEMIRRIEVREGDDQAISRRDRLVRLQYSRFTVAIANVLGLVVALPFFLSRVPRNMAVQSMKCAPVAVGAIMGGVLGATLPTPGVAPGIGVFLPLIPLAPMTLWAAAAIRT